MKKKESTERPPRKSRVLTIKITAEERAELDKVVGEQCINLSALVRKLLFEQLRGGR